jgi:16S rRNA (cytosine967-C5)-methyltransferase
MDLTPLEPRDRGLARELVLGAERFALLYDTVADRFLRPGPQPAPLRAALRLGAHQLLALDRVPPHAAVATTVGALRACGYAGLAGVANAVLRRLSSLRRERGGEGPLGRLAPADVPEAVHLRHALPRVLVEDLLPVLPTGTEADWAALNHVPPLCTRSRPGLGPLPGRSILRQDGPWTWWDDPDEALAGPVADGRARVQDRSQGYALEAARVRPGELVADLCAAPGGKSIALAEAGARVISADVDVWKCRDLMEQGLATLCANGHAPALVPGAFDVVVVDAPCSNTGVLARRPEAKRRYTRAVAASLARLQAELLTAAAALVRPDGRLLYATCSLTPAENQGVTHRLDGWRVLAEHRAWPDAWQAGGYACVLVRV